MIAVGEFGHPGIVGDGVPVVKRERAGVAAELRNAVHQIRRIVENAIADANAIPLPKIRMRGDFFPRGSESIRRRRGA